jgi:hypothetical protein
MSQKTHSQDSNFEEIWKKMDEIEPLTPVQKSIQAYKEAAVSDEYMFGDYDGYQAYEDVE